MNFKWNIPLLALGTFVLLAVQRSEWLIGRKGPTPSSIMKPDALESGGNYHKRCNKVTQLSDKKRDTRTYNSRGVGTLRQV